MWGQSRREIPCSGMAEKDASLDQEGVSGGLLRERARQARYRSSVRENLPSTSILAEQGPGCARWGNAVCARYSFHAQGVWRPCLADYHDQRLETQRRDRDEKDSCSSQHGIALAPESLCASGLPIQHRTRTTLPLCGCVYRRPLQDDA